MTLRTHKFSTFGGSLTKIFYAFLISPLHDMRPNVSAYCTLKTCVKWLHGPVVHWFSRKNCTTVWWENKSSGKQMDVFIADGFLPSGIYLSMQHQNSRCVCVISLKDRFKIPVRPKQEHNLTSFRKERTTTLPHTVTARARYLAMTRSLPFQNSILSF